MSAKKKSESKERRKREKANRKSAQKALYQGYAAQGNNSKRGKIKAAAKTRLKLVSHAGGDCGNVGCQRCFPPTGKTFPIGQKGYEMALRYDLLKEFKKVRGQTREINALKKLSKAMASR